jgi:hypothetical protein
VNGIEAAAEQSILRSVGVEWNAEREDLAGADQACGLDDVLRRDLVQLADVLIFTPTAPVSEFLCRFGDGFLADLDVHRTLPFRGRHT